MDKLIEILTNLRSSFILMIAGLGLILLGFTGQVTDFTLIEGMEWGAVGVGLILVGFGIVLQKMNRDKEQAELKSRTMQKEVNKVKQLRR